VASTSRGEGRSKSLRPLEPKPPRQLFIPPEPVHAAMRLILVTKDGGILKNKVERDALREAGISMVVLHADGQKRLDMARMILKWFEAMERVLDDNVATVHIMRQKTFRTEEEEMAKKASRKKK